MFLVDTCNVCLGFDGDCQSVDERRARTRTRSQEMLNLLRPWAQCRSIADGAESLTRTSSPATVNTCLEPLRWSRNWMIIAEAKGSLEFDECARSACLSCRLAYSNHLGSGGRVVPLLVRKNFLAYRFVLDPTAESH